MIPNVTMRLLIQLMMTTCLLLALLSCSADSVRQERDDRDDPIDGDEDLVDQDSDDIEQELSESDGDSKDPESDFDLLEGDSVELESDSVADGDIDVDQDIDNETDRELEAWIPRGGLVSDSDPVHIYFSNVYSGDPAVAQNDPLNPDEQLVKLIASASASIHGSIYDFGLDDAAAALIAAKNRGVEVQLSTDDGHVDEEALQDLIEAGIQVVHDGAGALMHNKFLVIDQQIVWTGSMNLTYNGAFRNNNNALMIYSPDLAANYEAEFSEQFVNGLFSNSSPDGVPLTVSVGGHNIENYFAPDMETMDRLVELVEQAERSIHFLIFSFTDGELSTAMIDARRRGVEVKGVFEKRSAHDQYSEYELLEFNGVNVREDKNGYSMHHKLVIVDRSIVWTGSFNFSFSADNGNDENVVILHSAYLAQPYEAEFERIWKQ